MLGGEASDTSDDLSVELLLAEGCRLKSDNGAMHFVNLDRVFSDKPLGGGRLTPRYRNSFLTISTPHRATTAHTAFSVSIGHGWGFSHVTRKKISHDE